MASEQLFNILQKSIYMGDVILFLGLTKFGVSGDYERKVGYGPRIVDIVM